MKKLGSILRPSSHKRKYDYLIVGAGLYGATFAYVARQFRKKVLVIDRRPHIGGNSYTEDSYGIEVHKYGPHIFHTNSKEVWDFVNQFAEFNRFTNSPIANYRGEIYSMPFNMYTFNKMWGVVTPEEALAKIKDQQRADNIIEPKNLEEQAIRLVGREIYEKLVKGYTEKQWGRPCSELPPFIISRLPVRYSYDNNYFDALYQGIPIGGYTKMISRMLEGADVWLEVDYLKDRDYLTSLAKRTVYTGCIDEFFNFKFGSLEYRSVRFETEVLSKSNFQGNAVVNYTDAETPYTRIIEHKYFDIKHSSYPLTIISKEYPQEWREGLEPYYPINNDKNRSLYEEYLEYASYVTDTIFGGRLAEYKYYNMDEVILQAKRAAEKYCGS